ncbi:MAG: hypothetical protein HFH46_03515 [Bacilli bacterium]|nr:hypothetical protein [Bacilli bacterium]
MRRNRKQRNQRKIVVLSMICLLCIMTAGYAAFQTNLNITAKGNVINNITNPSDLKNNIVTSGDGLYKDSYEEGRYIYRGSNPNNYITFNDELWRIIAIEPDNTLKIIRNDIVKEMKFDEENHRSTEKNTYCAYPQYGCGVFAKISGIFTPDIENYSGTVTEDSSIKEYLNGEYYSSLSNNAQNQINKHSYNIGAVSSLVKNGNDTLIKNINGEKKYTWIGNVGLANVSDILRASTNPLCKSATDVINAKERLCSDSYFYQKVGEWWLINAYTRDDSTYGYVMDVWRVLANTNYEYPSINAHYISSGVRPTLFLKSNIILTGNGTETNPYIIQE